jgi:hypothetical protein
MKREGSRRRERIGIVMAGLGAKRVELMPEMRVLRKLDDEVAKRGDGVIESPRCSECPRPTEDCP